jgi:hypothetical protein
MADGYPSAPQPRLLTGKTRRMIGFAPHAGVLGALNVEEARY